MSKWGFAAWIALSITANAAPVQQIWQQRYNGPANREDVFSALTLDAAGQVYVTGSSDNNVNPDPYATIKYSTNGTQLWAARYFGPVQIDVPSAIAVDGRGYVYVTGFSHGQASGYDPDYATIKYAPEGTELWVARYNGSTTNQTADNPYALAVNGAGEVYVTGGSMSPQGNLDFATIKYNTNGATLWTARYNGAANRLDRASAMGLDSAGNIYVCGASETENARSLLVLLKYSPSGAQLWEAQFPTTEYAADLLPQMKVDPSGNAYIAFGGWLADGQRFNALKYGPDGALVWHRQHRVLRPHGAAEVVAVDLDDAGNLCVAGSSRVNSYPDYLVWKLSGAGEHLWTSRFGALGGGHDVARGMAIDDDGNIYVTGTSYNQGNQYEFATIKLTSAGHRQWVVFTTNGNNTGVSLAGVKVDAAGHVFVSGSSGQLGFRDYFTIKYRQLPQPGLPVITADPTGQIVVATGTANFSVAATGTGLSYQWYHDGLLLPGATNSTLTLNSVFFVQRGHYSVDVSNSAGTVASREALLEVLILPIITQHPASRQVIAGAQVHFSVQAEGSEPFTYQWLRNGVELPGTTNSTLVLSNVQPATAGSYVVRVSNGAGSTDSSAALLSLVPGVEECFAAAYRQTAQGYSYPQLLRLDSEGKAHLAQTVYVGERTEFLTLQFDTNGVVTWSARFVVGTNVVNTPTALALDSSGNVYVAGNFGPYEWRKIVVVKYGPSGNLLWATVHAPDTTNRNDTVNALAVDAAGNVYVTGGSDAEDSHGDVLTIKLSANGTPEWSARYAFSENSYDSGNLLQVDASGVYVFGVSLGGTLHLLTLKYDLSGNPLWTRTLDGGYEASAAAMKLDAAGNVVVSGSASEPGGNSDFVTVKYAPGGELLWLSKFSGMLDGYDNPFSLGLDGAGNIYVAGRSGLPNEENTGLEAFSIVKYDSNGNELWVASRIDNSSQGNPDSFAVDAAGNSYVTYGKYHPDSGADFVTAKYDSNGTRLWAAAATRSVYSDEYPSALALHQDGDVFVAGIAYNPVQEVLLFRYKQSDVAGLPVITEPPRSRDISFGAPVSFTVVAQGDALSYQWFFNGRPIAGATSPVYQIDSAVENRQGHYAVEVSNAAGTVLSRTAVLTISVAPVIVEQPRGQSVLPGSDVTFEVVATGTRPLNYQWRFNGTNIPDARTATLSLPAVTVEQRGVYTVVVTNRAGIAVSAGAFLSVTAQARRDWLAAYNPGQYPSIAPREMEVDAAGNVYITSQWYGSPYAYFTAKYNPSGEELWTRNFSSSPSGAEVYSTGLALDGAGNAYVTGWGYSNGYTGIVTVKYDPAGTQQWVREVRLPNQSVYAFDITVASDGSIYVVGYSHGSSVGIVTIKYNAAGNQLWAASYATQTSGGADQVKVATDSAGNVYVLGPVYTPGSGEDVVTIKYNSSGTEMWARRHEGDGAQTAIDLKVDFAGDVLVSVQSAFYTGGIRTIKYRGTDGATLWLRDLQAGINYGNDQPVAMEVDNLGNVYITGHYFVEANYDEQSGEYRYDYDVLTLKYSPDGNLLWLASFGAPARSFDAGSDLSLDGQGGLYVTGMAMSETGEHEALVLRYDTDGNRYWSDRYAPADANGHQSGVAVRAFGTNSVYVLVSASTDGYFWPALLKYTHTGDSQLPTITSGPSSQDAIAGNNVSFSVAASGAGPLQYQWYHNGDAIPGAIGAGLLLPSVEMTNAGFYFVEVSNGAELVTSASAQLRVFIPARIVSGPEDQCIVSGSHAQFTIQRDGQEPVSVQWYRNGVPIPSTYGGVAITNATVADAGIYSVVVSNQYGSMTASARLMITPRATLANATWYNSGDNAHDQPQSAVVDAQGNTYMVGVGLDGFHSVKFNPAGEVAWERSYRGTNGGSAWAGDVAVGADGAVYVSGAVEGIGENRQDIGTVKYDANGNQLWAAQYHFTIYDSLRDIQVDAQGNVYLLGGVNQQASGSQILLVKYDRDGTELWHRQIQVSEIQQDSATAMALDAAGNVYVTGTAFEENRIEYYMVGDYFTLKCDTDGNLVWVTRHNGPGLADDRPNAIAVDAQGHVYVTGSHSHDYSVNSGTTVYYDYDFATIKYNTNGQRLWLAVYTSPRPQPDEAYALKVDAAGNVYVLGSSEEDIVTVKYNAAGQQQWVSRLNAGSYYDAPRALALDTNSNIYVTGLTGDGDILTFKLDANGSRVWLARYTGPGGRYSSYDYPLTIGLDAVGNVYVPGSIDTLEYSRDYVVLKYQVADAPGSPVITTPPHDTTAFLGGTATLSVEATGDAPLAYQWRRNGVAIAGATGTTLQLTGVTFADAGRYSVAVYNASDCAVSAEVVLTVILPEAIYCTSIERVLGGPAMRLFIAGPAACTYRIDCTTDFSRWESLGTVYNSTGLCQFTDTTNGDATRRFYRIVKLE